MMILLTWLSCSMNKTDQQPCETSVDCKSNFGFGHYCNQDTKNESFNQITNEEQEQKKQHRSHYMHSPPPGLEYPEESFNSREYFLPSGSPPVDRISRPLPVASPSTSASAGTDPAGSPQTIGSSSTINVQRRNSLQSS